MPTTPQTEEAIFAEALDKPSLTERAAFLNEACGDDAGLRARIERLLKSHTGAGSFLARPIAATVDPSPFERPGTLIGPYKLREQIGEGGFGVVFVAEQEKPVRRKVALKIIKPGMDTKDVIARFEAERQALALMDHPNVARVLDAGATESGRPYFVMELVHGVPITEFCDRNKLPMRDRLLLFADVCRAVQHAHQKGIIHRDLKPSNIMVTLHDGKPVAKVIDFGVSKALSQQLTEKSIYTAYGQMIGTPSYMSPEQAEMSGLGIDTRSDIYSLGVLLYELLTGKTPLDARRLRASAYAEILRIIKEEEPPRPSLKVSTLGDEATVIAEHRHTDPLQLRRELSGELDWIVMKCLDKDRARRYETASGLARDIERYLHDEPVEACPPSLAYRFRKFARKHRSLLATAASIAALLLVGIIVSSLLAAWAMQSQKTAQAALASERTARQEAVAARERAESYSQRLRTATQLVSEGTEFSNHANWAQAHERFTKAAQIEPDLNAAYLSRSSLYTKLGLWDRAAADYDRRFQLTKSFNVGTFNDHAILKLYLGDDAGYRQICQECAKRFSGSTTNNIIFWWLHTCTLAPQPVGDPSLLAQRAERLVTNWYVPWTLHVCAIAHVRAGNYEQAVTRSREALKFQETTGLNRCSNLPLAMALHHQGKHEEAQAALAQAEGTINQWTKTMADGSPGTLPIEWHKWLSSFVIYRETKQLLTGAPLPEDQRLVMIRERALAAITYGDAFTFMEEGREHLKRQAWDQAATSFAKVLDQLPRDFRPGTQEMRFCIEMTEQAEAFTRLTDLRPRDHRLWNARGRRFAAKQEWAKAIANYERAIATIEPELPMSPTPSNYGSRFRKAVIELDLACVQLLGGDETGYRQLCATIANEPLQVNASPASHLARACVLIPDAVADWSIPLKLASDAATTQPVAWNFYGLGIVQYRAGRHEEAIEMLTKSLEVQSTWAGRGQNYVALAMACHALDRADEAHDWLTKAQAFLSEMDATNSRSRFGYAGSDYLGDWLTLKVLLPQAEKLLAEGQGT